MAYEGFDGWSGLTDKERADLADMDRVSIALGGEGVLGQFGLDALAADDSNSRPATSSETEVAVGIYSDGDQPVAPPAPNEESSMKPEKIDDATQFNVNDLKDALDKELKPGDIEKIAPLDPTREPVIDLDRELGPEKPPSLLEKVPSAVQRVYEGLTGRLFGPRPEPVPSPLNSPTIRGSLDSETELSHSDPAPSNMADSGFDPNSRDERRIANRQRPKPEQRSVLGVQPLGRRLLGD
jgi:hypothetical protein